jgi:hypothetical protein
MSKQRFWQQGNIEVAKGYIPQGFPEPDPDDIGQQAQRNHLFQEGLLLVHQLGQVEQVFAISEGLFNGLITNDKFCLIRRGQLKLTWWRRPLRLRK